VAWCGDVTWIPTDEGWPYLASVIDLAPRHLLGCSMAPTTTRRWSWTPWTPRRPPRGRVRLDGTVFHADRGAEYASAACADACTRLGLRRSMGRTGSCLDNAVAEGWFASLEGRARRPRALPHRAEARVAVFRWIAWYDRFRLHSARGYLPPTEWESQHATVSPPPPTTAA
jgi:putative transposase